MMPETSDLTHFHQKPRRRAEFMTPVNSLKSKVGYGGLSDEILQKAQTLLENMGADYEPMAELYQRRDVPLSAGHDNGRQTDPVPGGRRGARPGSL
jgi:hypothetical protein